MHAFQLCQEPQNVSPRRVTTTKHTSRKRPFSIIWPAVKSVDLYVFGGPDIPNVQMGTPIML